ncbi:MAG: endonuclease domain-containing protein [Candidatus Cloacimonetes bacterium]|nr:endonuclease domain-containing protein [Candidatus Cloacimonadota bacterium]
MQVHNKIELKERRKELRKNQTPEEKKLWEYLRNRKLLGIKFFRQYSINYYIVDFYAPKLRLVIEIDGLQHFTDYGKEYDNERTEILNSLKINIIRFRNESINNEIERVVEDIEREISKIRNKNSP